MIKTATIHIKLQSDLCAGSGYSFAGIIDSDICYDDCGIPYIPATRLKGCMRETAENVLYTLYDGKKTEELFGIRGNDHLQGIQVGNAYIPDYELLRKEIATALKLKTVNQQEVLELFTHVQAQTAMKNGVADPTTLRYTRVVDQYSPLDKEKLCFNAGISFEDGEEGAVETAVRNILAATRNIGLKRNRGMGSVTCTLEDVRIQEEKSEEAFQTEAADRSAEKWKKITYIIQNEDPLMISGNTDDHSEKYIPGQAVLGALAGRFPKAKQSSDDPDFRAAFLGEDALYCNVYPYADGQICYPAPEYLNRLKKSKCYVNSLFAYSDDLKCDSSYNPAEGNIPKKLKGKFAAGIEYDHLIVHDVDMQVTYHHSHSGPSGKEGQLYPMICIQKGQKFAGEIFAKESLAPVLVELLKQGPLYFGKSRTAQYGKCVLLGEPTIEPVEAAQTYEAGQWIVVELLSDAVIVNDAAEYTVYSDEVKAKIASELGIHYDQSDMTYDSRITPGIVNGYLRIWNLRKPPVPVIKAGSCILYYLTDSLTVDKLFVGERNVDGFGCFKIRKLKDMQYIVPTGMQTASEEAQDELTISKALISEILLKKALQEAKLEAIKDRSIKVSKSALGRITLMLKESNRILNRQEAFKDFGARIESIKKDAVRKNVVQAVLKKFGTPVSEKTGEEHSTIWQFREIPQTETVTGILKAGERLGITYDEMKKQFDGKWADYLMEILVSQKYEAAKLNRREEAEVEYED